MLGQHFEAAQRKGVRWPTLLGTLAAFGWGLGLAACGGGDAGNGEDSLRAVECVEASDCPGAEQCVDGACQSTSCPEDTVACAPGGRATLRCDAGHDASLVPCPSEEHCLAVDGIAACRPIVCAPGERTCSDDVTVERCADDGSGVEQRIDCAALAAVCHEGECVEADEEPGTDEHEPLCVPGFRECNGDQVVECDSQGRTLVSIGVDCADQGAVCFAGECRERACEVPFECADEVSLACVEDGTRIEAQPCGADTSTFCNPDNGRCEPYVCAPGAAVCAGNRATRCDDVGSGPLETGVDCAELDKACWDGGCASVVCSTAFVCNGAELLECRRNGTLLEHVEECALGTLCDAELGSCEPEPCTPDAPACLNDVATVCKHDGLGFVPGGTNCGLNDQTCVAGACAARVCTPNATLCDGQNLRLCNSIGSASELLEECDELETCDALQGSCVADACSPGAPVCDGDVVTVCAPDGSGPMAGGQDCSQTGKVCFLGECKVPVCSPDASFCASGTLYQCDSSGTVSAPVQACELGSYCEDSAAGAACVPDN